MPLFQNQYVGHTDSGETWIFSFWTNTGETIDSMNSLGVSWINTFWTGGYDAFCTAGVGVDQVNTREIIPGDGGQVRLRQAPVALSGVATGDSMPADVAIVVSLRTDLANRRGRGRFYLPQPAESTGTTDGRIAQATIDGIISALTAAWSAITPATEPVVYSRTNRSFEVVQRFNIGDLYDTQRRRENKLVEARTGADVPF